MIELVESELTLVNRKAERRQKTRQILYSMAIGGLIGAFLTSVFMWKASAGPLENADADAQQVCELIVANPSMHGVDSAMYMLLGKGYGIQNKEAMQEFTYAIKTYCPREIPLVNQWANAPTINGSTPEGGIA
jgi:hypothetical protein